MTARSMATRTARKSAWLCDAITGLRSLVRNHYVMYATRVDPPVGRGAGCSCGCGPTGWPRREGHLGDKGRWELLETEPGTTQITETFDYNTAKAPKLLELIGQPAKNGIGITKTLEALAARFA